MSFGLSPAAQAQSVPSGQSVTLYDAIVDEVSGQSWLRLRFLAPAISRNGGTIGFEDASADMEHLCAHVGLPYAAEYALTPATIVITLSDRETEFGVQDPDATQFFDAYRVENQTCIWEAF